MDLQCIFCHSDIQNGNKNYIFHLDQYHRIKFDMDHVVQRTLDLIEAQKTKKDVPTVNSEYYYDISDIVNDIVEKVIGNLQLQTTDKYDNSINKSIDYFDNTKIGDIAIAIKCEIDEFENRDEQTGNLISSPLKLLGNPTQENEFFFSSIARLNNIKSALNVLGKDEESIDIGIVNNNLATKNNEKGNDLPEDDTGSKTSWKTNLGEMNIECYVKIEEIKKELVEKIEHKNKPKRSYASAFSQELSSTGRRKSARLEIKTSKSSLQSPKVTAEEPDFFEHSQIKQDQQNTKDLIKDLLNDESIQSFDHFLTNNDKQFSEKMFSEKIIDRSSCIPWYYGTIHSCDLCPKQYLSKSKFKMHMESIHNTQCEDKNTQSKTHECEICGKGVSWYKSAIESHLSGQHNTNLNDYYEKFKDEMELPTFTITDETLLSRYNFTDKQVAFNLSNVEETKNIHDSSITNLNPEWSNKCIFQCALCQSEFNSRYKFGLHLKSHHNLTVTEYTKEHGKSILHEELHCCQVRSCSAVMIWDKTSIYNHLKTHDKMPIEEYEAGYMSNYTDKPTKLETDYEWSNRCIFKCALCEKELNSRTKFGTHLKARHELTVTEYTKDHGPSMSHEEKHSCQVENCSSYIWWDSKTIKSHLYGVHDKMSIEEYETTYMSKYEEKIITGSADTTSKIDVDYEWANQCTFQCVLCCKEFNSKSKFGTHLKSLHQLSITEYTKDHGKSILHEEKHSCQIESCDASIIWDRLSISRHLRNVHDLVSLEDYKERYMENYVEKEIPNRLSQEEYEESNIKESTSKSEWFNKCIFKCIPCEKEFNSRRKIQSHLKSQHELTIAEYTSEHGAIMSHEEKHCCQIENCNSNMLWDYRTIHSHLYRSHNKMSLDEYEKMHMSNYTKSSKPDINNTTWSNKCTFKCVPCQRIFNSRSKLSDHLKSLHQLSIKEYTKLYGKPILHEEKHSCQVESCRTFMLWDRTSIKNHLKMHDLSIEDYNDKYMGNYVEKDTEVTSKQNDETSIWANMCIFKCSLCNFENNSRYRFKRHVQAEHKLTIIEYTKQFGRTMSLEEKHSCQIDNCNSYIWWDKRSIYNHLQSVHDKISLEEYKEKYMSNYKEKILGTSPKSKKFISTQPINWANRCIFKCVLCEMTTKSNAKFTAHIKMKHNLSKGDYATEHGRTTVHEEKHACQVKDCASKFWWSVSSFIGHFKLKHDNLTLSEYEKLYMADYKETDLDMTKSEAQRPEHGKEDPEDDDVLQWTTGSLYLCKVCDKGIPGLYQFKKHLESRHDTDYKQYETTYQPKDFILFSGFHICQVCQKNIKHDRIYLQNHMKEHDLTIRHYMDKYKPRPPKLSKMMKDRQTAQAKKE